MKLVNRVAIVTGSGEGIGKAIATAFTAEGARVVLAARTFSKLESVSNEIRSRGGIAKVIQTDISDEKQVSSMVSQTLEEYKQIDILVNNSTASSDTDLSVVDMDLNQWEAVIKVNLTGTMLCCREVLKAMIPRKGGNIINIGSVGGMSGMAKRSAYCSSKWGIVGLTQTLAIETGPYNIRVNCISPAATNTERFQLITRSRGMSVDERINKSINQYSLRRIVEVSEIAKAAVFLASDNASAITGQNLPVTCGFHVLGPGEIN